MKKGSVSLSRFPLFNHFQIISCEVPLVYRLDNPYSCVFFFLARFIVVVVIF